MRSRTRPEARPITRCRQAGEHEARDRLAPQAVKRQQSDGIGAGAEERRMAERDDAGIAEREIEREREQDRDQKLGAEAQIVGKDEIDAERDDPGQRLPPAQAVPPDEDARRRMVERRGAGDRPGGAVATLTSLSFRTIRADATAGGEW